MYLVIGIGVVVLLAVFCPGWFRSLKALWVADTQKGEAKLADVAGSVEKKV